MAKKESSVEVFHAAGEDVPLRQLGFDAVQDTAAGWVAYFNLYKPNGIDDHVIEAARQVFLQCGSVRMAGTKGIYKLVRKPPQI